MSAIRAATVLALWGTARARGAVSPDSVLSALSETGFTAGVRAVDEATSQRLGLPGPGSPGTGTLALLDLFRPRGTVQLLLPVAGDVRGFPVGHPGLVTALDAGAAVLLVGPEALVIPDSGLWRVHGLTVPGRPSVPGSEPGGAGTRPSGPGPETDSSNRTSRLDGYMDRAAGLRLPLPWSVHEAEVAIDRAIVQATGRLRTLDIARDSRAVRDRLAAAMRRAAIDSPPTLPRPASALLAKVISLEALLSTAADHETAAVSRYELAAVDDALRPLSEVVRQGRIAAVAAGTAEVASLSGARR